MTPVQVGLLAFASIVFPGLIFLTALGLFSEWFLRKLVARMQNRMGPTYVGPAGLLQPLFDTIKLLFVKEEKGYRYGRRLVARLGLAIAMGGIAASVLMLPISPARLAGPYDVVVFAYVSTVLPLFATVIALLSYPNPFTVVGTSRLLTMATFIEPTWIVALLVPTTIATLRGSPVPYSVFYASIVSHQLWLEPKSFVAMLLSLAAATMALHAKAMLKPFDIPEAEQELIAGHITEYSGPLLALYNLLHDVELAFGALVITYLFLGGPYPYGHTNPIGICVLIVKYVALLFVLTLVRASCPRLRIDQAVRFLAFVALPIAIVALALSLAA